MQKRDSEKASESKIESASDGTKPPPSLRDRRIAGLYTFLVIVTLIFGRHLYALADYVLNTKLHSHVVLIPFICAYLIRTKREELTTVYETSVAWAVVCWLVGSMSLLGALGWIPGFVAASLSRNDFLALVTFSYICFLTGGGFLFLGKRWMRQASFPVAFLLFMIPLPDGAVDWVEHVLVLASAEVTHLFFSLSGTPVYREGTMFQIPGIVLEVAKECSGIRSSWVLFITSLLASYLLLRSPWHRAILVAAVIPLGILRNGFRILVIGLMCVHMGPEAIDSVVHKRGGPAFFAISLIPLFALAWWLHRREHRLLISD